MTYAQEYYIKNKEKFREYWKRYREKNREYIKIRDKKYYCKTNEYQREHAKQYYAKNKDKAIRKQRTHRIKCIEMWNWIIFRHHYNRCEICGYSRCQAAIELHHPNPTKNQEKRLARLKSRYSPRPEFWQEIINTIPLCANCHREIHHRVNINQ